jgi:glycosyltransferase involved in cell wall biosynthesis
VAERKKLLFLSQMFPLPVRSGCQLRTFNLLQRLSQRFDVTLFTLAADPGWEAHVAELGKHCARVVPVVPDNKKSRLHRAAYKALYWLRRVLLAESSDLFYNTVPNVNRQLRAELARTRYDVIFCEYWFWDQRVFAAPGLKVIDANDVQSERIERALDLSRNPVEKLLRPYLVRRYRRSEAEALGRADIVVATTVKDRAAFDAMTPASAEKIVLPTGLDTDYFEPQPGARPDPRNIVFYGALSNPMNRDAVQYLVRDILPRIRERVPGARLTIVGAFPPPEIAALAARDPGITVTGYVEDVRQPLSEAGVVVCPLRFGYGIRGRVFELMSMGVPVVATPVAVEGMELASGDGILLAENPNDFADAVAQVLSDATLRTDLGRRGRQITVERMSIAATYDRLAEILDKRTSTEPVPTRS